MCPGELEPLANSSTSEVSSGKTTFTSFIGTTSAKPWTAYHECFRYGLLNMSQASAGIINILHVYIHLLRTSATVVEHQMNQPTTSHAAPTLDGSRCLTRQSSIWYNGWNPETGIQLSSKPFKPIYNIEGKHVWQQSAGTGRHYTLSHEITTK